MQRHHSALRHLCGFCLVVPLLLLSACDGPRAGAPPLSFRYRQAQIPGKGLVAGIENQSKTETLSNFVIKITSPDAQRNGSYRVAKRLEPEDSMTIGWVELDGWELAVDDRLYVSCEQYVDPATSVVTKP